MQLNGSEHGTCTVATILRGIIVLEHSALYESTPYIQRYQYYTWLYAPPATKVILLPRLLYCITMLNAATLDAFTIIPGVKTLERQNVPCVNTMAGYTTISHHQFVAANWSSGQLVTSRLVAGQLQYRAKKS